jgi:outer membrane receptor protein involved in Fe transport
MAIGYGLFYYGVFEKIDDPWYLMVPGIGKFLDKAAPGDWVHNIRASYAINQNITMAILVNNLFNHEYTIRLAHIEPPRNFNIQARIRF